MTNKLFLSGEPGVGKTTIFQSVLQAYSQDCVGFYTQELREDGIRVGFDIIPINLPLKSGPLAHTSFEKNLSVGKYGINLQHLETVIKLLTHESKVDKILMIDEIGLMEAFSQPFKDFIVNSLEDSDQTMLATLSLAEEPWIDDIKKTYSVTVPILTATTDNRTKLPGEIIEVLKLKF